MHIKPFEELTIQDNFMFQKVMRNKRICKATIERLLDIQIKDITYLEEEIYFQKYLFRKLQYRIKRWDHKTILEY